MSECQKVFVAYFDILGFAKYVEDNTLDAVAKVINENFSLLGQLALAYSSVAAINAILPNDKKLPFPNKKTLTHDGKQAFIPDLTNIRINSVMIFDSVVFWTDKGDEKSLRELLYTASFFMRLQLSAGFPVRGAISYGDFLFSGRTLTSSALVQHFTLASSAQVAAQRLESKQLWAGCVLHESVINRCDELKISLDSLELIIKYPVPFASEDGAIECKEMYAVIWQTQERQIIPEDKILNITSVIRESFLCHGKKVGLKEEDKIIHTANFINFVFPIT